MSRAVFPADRSSVRHGHPVGNGLEAARKVLAEGAISESTPKFIDQEISESQRIPAIYAGIFLFDALLLFIATVRHTFWRDETQAWLIARDSTSVAALIHNLRYEGHPPLWHLLLYFITRFSWNPVWMKVPSLLLALAASSMVLFCSRLGQLTRIGIVFSYFIVFEYGVIARNYMLGFVLLLAAAVLTTGRNSYKSWAVPILVFLAALSSLPALILAVGIMGVHLTQEVILLRGHRGHSWQEILRILLPGAMLAGAGFLGSIFLILPPADSGASLGTRPVPHDAIGALLLGGESLARAFLPIPAFYRRFWDSSLVYGLGHHTAIVFDSGGWLILAGLVIYFRRPVARYFFLAGSSMLLLELAVTGRTYLRHTGWLFLCMVLALVMEHGEGGGTTVAAICRPRWQKRMLSMLLICQVYAGAFALALSFRYPFSSSREVAGFLESHGLASSPMVVEPDLVGSSVLAYLQRPTAFDLEQQRPASFIVWNRKESLNQHVPNHAEMYSTPGFNVVPPTLITGKPLTPEQQSELGMHLIAAFDNGLCPYDAYYIYR